MRASSEARKRWEDALAGVREIQEGIEHTNQRYDELKALILKAPVAKVSALVKESEDLKAVFPVLVDRLREADKLNEKAEEAYKEARKPEAVQEDANARAILHAELNKVFEGIRPLAEAVAKLQEELEYLYGTGQGRVWLTDVSSAALAAFELVAQGGSRSRIRFTSGYLSTTGAPLGLLNGRHYNHGEELAVPHSTARLLVRNGEAELVGGAD